MYTYVSASCGLSARNRSYMAGHQLDASDVDCMVNSEPPRRWRPSLRNRRL